MSEKIIAIVKSPSQDKHLREGNGFSLAEIQKAGKTVSMLEALGIKVDYRRKSVHQSNLEKLNTLIPSEKKAVKREPFKPKEKKKRAPKLKVEKIVEEESKIEEPKKEKIKKEKAKKEKRPAKKKEVKKEKPSEKIEKKEEIIEHDVIEEAKVPEEEPIALTELTGCGPATASKFAQIGISSIQDLIEEDPEELVLLTKGVSLERIKEWQDEAKKLLES